MHVFRFSVNNNYLNLFLFILYLFVAYFMKLFVAHTIQRLIEMELDTEGSDNGII
jgi:hypothetical protein